MNRIIVIGGTHHNTLSIIRCLGQEGVSVNLILHDKHAKNSYVLSSSYIHKYLIAKDEEEAVYLFKTNYDANDSVILCSDKVASMLNPEYKNFMDKQIQGQLAEKTGMNVPNSCTYTIGIEDLHFPLFPCIVKPLASIHGGKRFSICNNQKELTEVFATYQKGDIVQIQHYIKRDYEIVVDGVALNNDIIIPGFIKKYRDKLGGTSFSSTHPITQLPTTIVSQIKQMIQDIGYEGLFGVEFLVKDNKFWFVEINLRNDATTYALAVAGVNLPYIYTLARHGKNYEKEAQNIIREITAMVETRDFSFVLNKKISLLRWWKDFKDSECCYFYNKADMKPCIKAWKQYIYSKLKRIAK